VDVVIPNPVPPSPAPVTNGTIEPEPANGAKPARVKCTTWKVVGAQLAAEVHYYQKDGKVDWYHLTGAAGKLGYHEINDQNVDEVLRDLRQYAVDNAALAAQDAETA